MTPEEVIEGAIKGVERDGWHQRGFYAEPDNGGLTDSPVMVARLLLASESAPACAVGHLRRAACGNACMCDASAEEITAQLRAERLVSDAIGGLHIPEWNDDPRRTKEDVILAFKRAINHEKSTS